VNCRFVLNLNNFELNRLEHNQIIAKNYNLITPLADLKKDLKQELLRI
jgi:hypothetical protein